MDKEEYRWVLREAGVEVLWIFGILGRTGRWIWGSVEMGLGGKRDLRTDGWIGWIEMMMVEWRWDG